MNYNNKKYCLISINNYYVKEIYFKKVIRLWNNVCCLIKESPSMYITYIIYIYLSW